MNNEVGRYIESLIGARGLKQADVARRMGVQRQQLSYIISGARELTLPLALKLETYFDLPEGELLKRQAIPSVRNYKRGLREALIGKLKSANAFWSYAEVDSSVVTDEELIEKTLVYADLPDIACLFELFGREPIKKVWRRRLIPQGDYRFALNVMIALLYFDIKNPEQYLRREERAHLKKLLSNA